MAAITPVLVCKHCSAVGPSVLDLNSDDFVTLNLDAVHQVSIIELKTATAYLFERIFYFIYFFPGKGGRVTSCQIQLTQALVRSWPGCTPVGGSADTGTSGKSCRVMEIKIKKSSIK